MVYTVEYYQKHNKRLLADLRDAHGRIGELLKENRDLNDRLLQETRELRIFQAKNTAMRKKIKLAKEAIQIEEKKDNGE